MFNILMASNPEDNRVINGLIDGLTSLPQIVWDHAKQLDSAPHYNLSFLAGLLMLLALLVWVPIRGLAVVVLVVLFVFILTNT